MRFGFLYESGDSMAYYIQQIAGYYSRLLAPIPSQPYIPDCYLANLTNDEFVRAFQCIRETLLSILKDIQTNPVAFDMEQSTINTITSNNNESPHSFLGPITPGENKSIRSFQRIPKLFHAITSAGTVGTDGTILLQKNALKGIAKGLRLLNKLQDYGFEVISGESGIAIGYPDDKNVLTVLRVIDSVNPNILLFDLRSLHKGNQYVHTPEDIIRLIPEEHIRSLVRSIVEKIEQFRYSIKSEYCYNPARIRISKTKSAKEMINIVIERDSSTHIYLRLSHIASYSNHLGELSARILQQTLSGRTCCHCGYCKNGCVNFTFDGNAFAICSILCCGFVYAGIQDDDCSSILKLIEWELSA